MSGADRWPRCFGRYTNQEDAERAVTRQRQGNLIWKVKFVGGASHWWALMAFPYHMEEEAESWQPNQGSLSS